MANKKHLKILVEQGVGIWNTWRRENPNIKPDLRGADFTGEDFTEANFSEALIQGTNFTKTNLKGANFKKAKAGLTLLGATKLLVGLFFLSTLLGFFVLFCAALLGYFFTPEAIEKNSIFPGLFALVLFIIIFGSVGRLGLKPDLISVIIGGTAILTAFGWFLAVADVPLVLNRDEAPALTLPATALVVSAAAEAFTLGTAAIIDGKIFGRHRAWFFSLAGALFGIFLGLQFSAIETAIDMARPADIPTATVNIYVWCVISILVVAILLLSVYLAPITLISPKENALIFKGAVTFAAIGGTSFRGADLTDADFTQATLRSADFRNFPQATLENMDFIEEIEELKTKLIGTCWKEARELHLVRPGTTYLQYEGVRDLLAKGDGENKHFKFLNLQGINLKDANLINSNFIESDLSLANLEGAFLADANLKAAILNKANLRHADLSRAKLVNAQLYDSDLTEATLTGAFIEDWGISITTKLDEVHCDFIFMKLPTRKEPDPERRPAEERKFRPGEFASLIGIITNTVDLVFEDGIDWESFLLSFKELQDKYGKENIGVQAIEKKSDGAFVIRLGVPLDAIKAEVEASFWQEYKPKLEAKDRKIKLLSEQKEFYSQEVENIRQDNTRLLGIVETMAEKETSKVNMTFNAPVTGVAGNVEGDQNIYASEQKQTLAQAAEEIQKLLKQLEQTNPDATPEQQQAYVDAAISPTLKERCVSALKAGSETAIDEFFNNPYVKVGKAIVMAWIQP